MIYSALLMVLVLLIAPCSSYAAIKEETFDYKQGDTALEGYFVYDDALGEEKRPVVLVVHDWMGLSDYAKFRAQEVAKLGYAAMAVDIYGKGIRPKDAKEASEQATLYKKDRALMRARILAALEAVKSRAQADAGKIAAMGYCFGGTVVLELARSGADVKGVASFHGGLDTPSLAKEGDVKARVLVLHGADDPLVPAEEVAAFQEEMRSAKADWQMISYGDAVHSFTRPDAGDDKSKGVAYNPKADERSWAALEDFLSDIFQ